MKKNYLIKIGLLLTPLLLLACKQSSSEQIPNYEIVYPQVELDEDWPDEAISEETQLDFYNINDFHGSLSYNESSREIGINRLATYFDLKKQANPDGTIILSSGDMWQGSADSNITRGRLVVEAMNLIGFDAMTLGNHEFDWTDEVIRDNQEIADFPFLGANIYDRRTLTLADFVVPYTMINRQGVKIGIIGTIGATLKTSILASNVLHYDFLHLTPIIAASSNYLKEQGANVIVLINHDGNVENAIMNYVDMAFYGHTHVVYSRNVSGKPVLQAGYNGRGVAHVSLTYHKTDDAITYNYFRVDESLINQSLDESISMVALYNDYLSREINAVKKEKLGYAVGYFTKAKLGDLAVKTMLEYGKSFGAVAAFHNTGGVRDTIADGEVQYGDVYKVFPFDNELIVVTLTGAQLKWWLSQSDYVAGANPITQNLDGLIPIRDKSNYKIISINYLTEKNIVNIDQYPHNVASTVHTFEYVRELLKQKWQHEETLYAVDYLG